MDLKKAEKILHKMEKVHFDNMYPGYPFAMIGYFCTSTNCGEIDGEAFNGLNDFISKFESPILYQSLGSCKATKGDWLTDTKMDKYKAFLNADREDFYFDNLDAVKLYFAFYSAYRQYKDKDTIIFFVINGECEWVDVQVFESIEELNKYYKEYWTEEYDVEDTIFAGNMTQEEYDKIYKI